MTPPAGGAGPLRRAAFHMALSALLFAAIGALVKGVSPEIPTEEVTFFRSFIGLLALLPLLFRAGPAHLKTAHFGEHLYRGLSGLGAMYCSFYSVARMGLAEALLLNYTSPLFMPMIAKVTLGEPIPAGIWKPLAVGFAGILLILKPGADLFQPVALVALLAGVLAAVAQVGIRKLTRTEPTVRIVFYFAVISSAVSVFPAARVWVAPSSAAVWAALLATGALATVAQLYLTRAYRAAPPARVGPFIYATVAFAALLDWVFWGHLLDGLSLAGAVLTCAAGVLVLRRTDEPAPAGDQAVKA